MTRISDDDDALLDAVYETAAVPEPRSAPLAQTGFHRRSELAALLAGSALARKRDRSGGRVAPIRDAVSHSPGDGYHPRAAGLLAL
ncbi:MAG TPA: hypothetical protein VNR11_15325 [Xanthobacteraceae bacterium]|nr:hypothetical protein [Xanthobacteraceae bacterium]